MIAGMPRMDTAPLRALAGPGVAASASATCPMASSPSCCRSAALVVLPYREVDQSGVLFTALARAGRCC